MGLMETFVALAGGLVSLTVIVGSIAQATEIARLRRREAYYRDAAAGAHTTPADAIAVQVVRRRALARLVARDLVPWRLLRTHLLLAVFIFLMTTQMGRAVTIWIEDGFEASRAATGDLAVAFPLMLVALYIPLTFGFNVLYAVRDARKKAAEDFLEGKLDGDPSDPVRALTLEDKPSGSRPVKRMSLVFLALALAVGQGSALVSYSDPSPRSVNTLFVTVLVVFIPVKLLRSSQRAAK